MAKGDGTQVDHHAVSGDDEVFDPLEVEGDLFGQGELVLAGDFGEHGDSGKETMRFGIEKRGTPEAGVGVPTTRRRVDWAGLIDMFVGLG